MRIWTMTAAGACLLAMTMSASANPAAAATAVSRADSQPMIQLAQAEPKKETMAHKVERKVKRAWRKMTGYKFEVGCLLKHTTCTETGTDRDDARSKCIAAHPLCVVTDTK